MEPEILGLMNEKRNKKKRDIIDNTIWTHKCSSHPVNMEKVMETQNKACNFVYSLLFSDNRAIILNNPIYKRRKINKKKQSNFLKYISGNSEKILNKAYNKINFMKNESKELQKLNSLSMQKTSKKYFRTNRPKTSTLNNSSRNRLDSASTYFQTHIVNMTNTKLKKNLFNNNLGAIFSKNKKDFNISTHEKTETNNLPTNENTKENTMPNRLSLKKKNISNSMTRNKKNYFLSAKKPKFETKSKFSIHSPILFEDKGEEKYRNLINIDINKLYSTNKKKHLNLERLNDVYRVQMNKSLSHYNAENHLKELNKIQRDNISVRQSMENVKYKMNQKINDRCQGQYYKKEYLKFKEEYEKEKKAKSLEKKPFPLQIPFNILFKDNENNKNVKVFPNGYKIRAYYDYCANCDRIQKSKNNDLLQFGADLLFGHLHNKDYELLYDTLDDLFNTLKIEPIAKYIDKFKNEKICKNKNILSDRMRNYFPILTETEKKIIKMEKNQIVKRKAIAEEGNVLEKIDQTKKLLGNIKYNDDMNLYK